MKTRLTFLLFSLTCLIPHAMAEILFDDFKSTVIDTALWTPRAPFPDSSISLTGETVVFLNHGELLSKTDFANSLEVRGRFRFTGNIHDLFTVAIRTTGANPDPRFLNDGFHFEFAKLSDDGTRANVVQVAKYVSGVGTVVAAATQDFSLGQFYDFKVSDNGTDMKFYFDDLDTPILTVSDTATFGHKVGIYNREGSGGGSSISAGSQLEVDFIEIKSFDLHFDGFFPPINGGDLTGGSFDSPLRTFKLGSTIPVRFAAFLEESPVLEGIHTLEATKFTNSTSAGDPIDASAQDVATTGNQFRLADGVWQFNLDTKGTGMTVGVWLFTATLTDGSEHTVWIQLK